MLTAILIVCAIVFLVRLALTHSAGKTPKTGRAAKIRVREEIASAKPAKTDDEALDAVTKNAMETLIAYGNSVGFRAVP
jgi:hypothetical protein